MWFSWRLKDSVSVRLLQFCSWQVESRQTWHNVQTVSRLTGQVIYLTVQNMCSNPQKYRPTVWMHIFIYWDMVCVTWTQTTWNSTELSKFCYPRITVAKLITRLFCMKIFTSVFVVTLLIDISRAVIDICLIRFTKCVGSVSIFFFEHGRAGSHRMAKPTVHLACVTVPIITYANEVKQCNPI